MRELHIILSCTARKRGSDPRHPRLRTVGRTTIPDRVEQWVSLVSAAPRRSAAADLYAGAYWHKGMELVAQAEPAGQVMVSVVSAGLGLVGLDDEVPMYSATLAASHPDSVLAVSGAATQSAVRREWWDALTHAAILGHRRPRRLINLTKGDSSARVMVCVGRSYLDAVAVDLAALVERLADPRQVMVFASGAPLVGLNESWVKVPGKIRLALGGSSSSTNPRVAMAVLAELGESPPNTDRARSIVGALAATVGELPSFDRRRHRDKDVSEWILDYLTDAPNGNKTRALRRFRDEGNACEQARFGRLFDEARELVA